MQKAKYSSAKEPISTQYANKRATRVLGTIKKQQILPDNQIVKELMEFQKMYELTLMTSSASLEAVLGTK